MKLLAEPDDVLCLVLDFDVEVDLVEGVLIDVKFKTTFCRNSLRLMAFCLNSLRLTVSYLNSLHLKSIHLKSIH
ncbi:uncharacterized protein PHALS_11254 [Plasmopara halstedii]|uniref:Uncharacterized protein n=1 Tax=Plasmopara halstedii TaxID=4781 RepID=A0A0P1AIV6_PLAHL|nr:uncharacterized protein PHALS_11254 [Plasmopara halstedii]CEG41086.1 hypothetical protein PHALS_11254 [Plasmopara halstedii]|eukprot:XP_024577455.1 hypothetical protein PHALS_11254 [Plasmopara halstedii]